MGTVATSPTSVPPAPAPQEAFEYTKALFANVNEWYKDAHARAQAVLALDGTFVTILAGLIVLKAEDLTKVIGGFERNTQVALILMAVCFVNSFAFALNALMPRGLWRAEALYRQKTQGKAAPIPEVMWWSQYIRQMSPVTTFIDATAAMTDDLHRQTLAAQIFALSTRLKWKYRSVYIAQVFTGLALIALLLATAFYVTDHGW